MELRHLRLFAAVADETSFNRAAEKVGLAQPALSQKIRSLERELGVDLFSRTPQGVKLTEAGHAFLPEALETLSQADRAANRARRAAQGRSGQLRLGFTDASAMNPIAVAAIRLYRQHYPELEFTVEEAGTSRLLRMIETQDLEIALIVSGPKSPPGVESVRLDDEPFVAVLPTGHPLAGEEKASLTFYRKEPFVFPRRDEDPNLFQTMLSACRGSGFEPILGPIAPELMAVPRFVATGLGVSVTPASLAIGLPGIVMRSFSRIPPQSGLWLVYGRKQPPAAILNFIRLARTVATEIRAMKQEGCP